MNMTNRWINPFIVALAIGVMGATAAMAAGPIGELDVRGNVQIGQQGNDGTVTVHETTYGWFSGDRINTRSGHAVLNLDEAGASFGFGKNTEARLSSDGGRISVELESGVILYAVEGDAAELSVASGEYRFSTTSSEARPMQVASELPMSAGMIEVLEDGEVRVTVREGVMMAADVSGALHYRVGTGEAVAFAGTEPRQVQVQAGAARDDDDDRGIAAWIRNNPALTGLIIAVGAYGAYKIFFDDDDDDPEPVSP